MAKQLADVEIHASDEDSLTKEENLDISVDLIDDNLYLGNLSCARNAAYLEKLGVTHILTIDLVPLPRYILEQTKLKTHFLKLADVPKEDLISHLPSTNEFISQAIGSGGTVLVHCYFGVSRSAAVVIAYIMAKYKLCYLDAFTLVKGKRRFISPNLGFVAQLKLFGHMRCTLDPEDPRYKQFRLRLAGQKLKQVKILPQVFRGLVRADPGLACERPSPRAVRCRACRRVLAAHCNLLPHAARDRRHARPAHKHDAARASVDTSENGQILIEKLQSLACQINNMMKTEEAIPVDPALCSADESQDPERNHDTTEGAVGGPSHLDGHSELNMVDSSIIARPDVPEACTLMWFVEPMSWMKDVQTQPQGKLHCPKCHTKIGSFNWVMGCKCPCGQKVAPAFYLVPSKVECANIVQNVQVTV